MAAITKIQTTIKSPPLPQEYKKLSASLKSKKNTGQGKGKKSKGKGKKIKKDKKEKAKIIAKDDVTPVKSKKGKIPEKTSS